MNWLALQSRRQASLAIGMVLHHSVLEAALRATLKKRETVLAMVLLAGLDICKGYCCKVWRERRWGL
jgi:hypothetical protein